jgi:hypothetical protein
MRAFLGKVGYYRRFIKDYGAIARPLSEATKEENLDGKKIRMTDEIKAAHLKLRKALCEAPILAYPRFDGGPFIVDTDWSYDNRAIGGVLSQVQEGNERAICYGAKKLSSSQANYSATKGGVVCNHLLLASLALLPPVPAFHAEGQIIER